MAKHVIIIGAGLGGPCLALCLARRGIQSTIYELRRGPSASGGSISLHPHALKVLDKYCGVLKQLQQTGFAYNHLEAYTDGGEKLGVIQAGNGDHTGVGVKDPKATMTVTVEGKEEGEGVKKGYSALRIMRNELQRVLVDACEQSGKVKVKYGMKIKQEGGIEEEAFGVRVQFEDGSEDHGDLLVGADGIHSQIRDYVLGPTNKVTPTYDGICVVNGFVPSSKISIPDHINLPVFCFSQSGIFMGIPINHDASTLAWGVNLSLPDRSREEWAEFEKSGEACRLAKKAYEGWEMQPIRDMLDLADDTKARIWSTYSIGEISHWSTGSPKMQEGRGKGRVVLMGDAAHGMPPNGLGVAMALEDAATLCRLISENKEVPSTADTIEATGAGQTQTRGIKRGEEEKYKAMMRRYEDIRRPRVKKVGLGGKQARSARTKSADWVWWAKKWAFRAFFWWKGGVIVHLGDDGFDIDTIDVKV